MTRDKKWLAYATLGVAVSLIDGAAAAVCLLAALFILGTMAFDPTDRMHAPGAVTIVFLLYAAFRLVSLAGSRP